VIGALAQHIVAELARVADAISPVWYCPPTEGYFTLLLLLLLLFHTAAAASGHSAGGYADEPLSQQLSGEASQSEVEPQLMMQPPDGNDLPGLLHVIK